MEQIYRGSAMYGKIHFLNTRGMTLIRRATCLRYMSFIIIQFFGNGYTIFGYIDTILYKLEFR